MARIWVQQSLQEPNVDQHRPSMLHVAPSFTGGTATCSMATGVVTTQQGVLALLTSVMMRATSKSEDASEEFLSL